MAHRIRPLISLRGSGDRVRKADSPRPWHTRDEVRAELLRITEWSTDAARSLHQHRPAATFASCSSMRVVSSLRSTSTSTAARGALAGNTCTITRLRAASSAACAALRSVISDGDGSSGPAKRSGARGELVPLRTSRYEPDHFVRLHRLVEGIEDRERDALSGPPDDVGVVAPRRVELATARRCRVARSRGWVPASPARCTRPACRDRRRVPIGRLERSVERGAASCSTAGDTWTGWHASEVTPRSNHLASVGRQDSTVDKSSLLSRSTGLGDRVHKADSPIDLVLYKANHPAAQTIVGFGKWIGFSSKTADETVAGGVDA